MKHNNVAPFRFWGEIWSGLWKISFTTFFPILFWTSNMELEKRIIHFFNIPDALAPLFLTAILVGVPGMFFYACAMYVFRKCLISLTFMSNKKPFLGNFANTGTVGQYRYKPQSVSVKVTLTRLVPIAFMIIKIFRLKLILSVDPKLAIIKTPNNDERKGSAFQMNQKGELELDITKKVGSVNATGFEFQETLIITPVDQIDPGTCKVVLSHGRDKLFGWFFGVEVQNANMKLGE